MLTSNSHRCTSGGSLKTIVLNIALFPGRLIHHYSQLFVKGLSLSSWSVQVVAGGQFFHDFTPRYGLFLWGGESLRLCPPQWSVIPPWTLGFILRFFVGAFPAVCTWRYVPQEIYSSGSVPPNHSFGGDRLSMLHFRATGWLVWRSIPIFLRGVMSIWPVCSFLLK